VGGEFSVGESAPNLFRDTHTSPFIYNNTALVVGVGKAVLGAGEAEIVTAEPSSKNH